jgi:FlaA1/EpsC-like NDP-sugar epimerase
LRTKWSIRNRHFFLLDLVLLVISAVLSFVIRLENFDLHAITPSIGTYLVISLVTKLPIYLVSGLYRRYWHNAGPSELLLVATTSIVSGLITSTIIFVVVIGSGFNLDIPRSVPMIDTLLATILITASRFSLRARTHLRASRTRNKDTRRALIVGAGHTGTQALYALEQTSSQFVTVGFLDDDPTKIGTLIRGRKVFGRIDRIESVVSDQKVDLVVIALPSAPGMVIRKIVSACQLLGVSYQIVPGLYELVSGKISVNTLRPIAIDDLLRRNPIQLNIEDIQQKLSGKSVMVTGAGGSIGSELARQVANCNPRVLILVGHGENSLFAIEQKIKNEFPHVRATVVLCDVRNRERLETVFAKWKPDLVYHAAAHKHVPMLETNVAEAVINNVIGTSNMVELCKKHNVARMVLISSDKAVNPTNVMGMTKRVAELIVLNAGQSQPGRFAAVRFGNVLGSRGSVVPIFQQQIAAGGPVTITSAKMTRFFMSIPEAVLLVLKASTVEGHGPLFVLNMGNPVKILDLADDLIRLSGFEPGRDIEIKEVGIRPGEKMHEELFWSYEDKEPIEQNTIFALKLTPEQLQYFSGQTTRIARLIAAANSHDDEASRELLKDIVFVTPEAVRPNTNQNNPLGSLSPIPAGD